MALRQKSLMDIDIDDGCNLLPLKRYNSAPYISSAVVEINTSTDSVTSTIDTLPKWTLISYILFNIDFTKVKCATLDVV